MSGQRNHANMTSDSNFVIINSEINSDSSAEVLAEWIRRCIPVGVAELVTEVLVIVKSNWSNKY